MRKLLLLGTTLLSLCGPAFAADVAVKTRAVTAAPVADPFTGWFIGAELGYGWGRGDIVLPGVPNVSPSGILAGGSLTYRSALTPGWYLGLTSSLDYLGGSDTRQIVPGVSVVGKNRWLGATMAQIGYAIQPNLLLYGQGGVAYGSAKGGLNVGAFSASDTERGVGWALGAGLEYAIAPNWTAKVEYVHYDLGKANFGVDIIPGITIGGRADMSDDVVKVGVNYKFGL